MIPRLVVSPRAVTNPTAIWNHLKKEAGEPTADRVEAEIRGEFSYLAQFPLAGHLRPELSPDPVRFLSVYSYLIAYRRERKPLEIVAFLHGKRDVKRLLGSGAPRSS